MGLLRRLTLWENPRGVVSTSVEVQTCRDCGSTDVTVHSESHPHHPGFVHCRKCGSCKA